SLARGDDERGGVGHELRGRDALRGGDGEVGGAAREVAVRGIVGRRSDRARREPRLVVGAELGGGVVAAGDLRQRLRLGEPGEVGRATHASTPIWTLVNRAGDAPCETCALWPGWPLPQFVSPESRHSLRPATASSEPQKTGVIPV